MEFYIQDTESLQKDCKDIKRNLSVVQNNSETAIAVVAISPDEDHNRILAIPAESGVPLQRSVYDTVRDCCVVRGIEYESLGKIPVGYSLVDGENDWEYEIPVPSKVINRYLTERQKKALDAFVAKFKKHNIVYIQFILSDK